MVIVLIVYTNVVVRAVCAYRLAILRVVIGSRRHSDDVINVGCPREVGVEEEESSSSTSITRAHDRRNTLSVDQYM